MSSSFLEAYYPGEQVTEMGGRELGVFANSSIRKRSKRNQNIEKVVPISEKARVGILSFKDFKILSMADIYPDRFLGNI